MGRSSRLALLLIAMASGPSAARAQFYGFPSEVGVIDDGFGVLPPRRSVSVPREGTDDPGPPLPPLAAPPAPPPCPLVIAVGRGLQHPAKVRVVYGRPPACR